MKLASLFRKLLALCLLGILLTTLVFPAAPASAIAEDYMTKVYNFINDARWKDGASYGAIPPKSWDDNTHSGCYAYMSDFVHEVWPWPSGTTNFKPTRVGTKFTDPSEIRDGDVIYIDNSSGTDPHYYAVLQRYEDGSFWTAEGNDSAKATVSKDAYSMSSLGNRGRVFKYGWHMPSVKPTNYFAVTKDNYANIRSGYYETEKSIYQAPRGSYYKILGSFTNEHKNLWYQVELPDGSSGWIFSGNGTTCTPRTETIKNYNCNYYVPIHTDYYGKASNVFTVDGKANDNTAVTVYAEVKNSYGNTWYLVKHSKGMGWLWADYCSDSYAMVCAVSYKSYRVIDDPEAGVLGVSMSGTVFDAEGASSFTVSSEFTSIDSFKNASALKTVNIPTSVTTINANAFSSCSSLTTVNYAGTSAQWNDIYISSTGNSNLTKAKIVYQANPASAAGFSSVSATPATTNAMLNATVTVTSGSGTFTGSGIRLYNSSGTLIASKDETHSYYRSASGTSSYNIWYDVTKELGKTLTAGTSYSYQFYTVFNGETIWSSKKSFTTTGQSMNFTFTLEEVTETSFTFSFKGTASTTGKFSEFGCKLIDLNTGAVKLDYSNTTDKNLNVSGAKYFSINSWELSGSAGHTYSVQLYYVFNGKKYSSSVYTVTFPDKTAPGISNAETFNVSANGFSVSCTATDNNAVKNVQFAVWTTNGGQDDLVYHNGVQDGNEWSCSINTGDGHNSEADCTYSVKIIATDMNGNQTTQTLSQYIDATPPVISDVVAVPLYNGKYKVTCTVADDREMSSVKGVSSFSAAAKTVTNTASASDGVYSFTVSCANLGSAAGYYATRINACDAAGNLTTQTVSIYIDALAPVISDVRVANITRTGFDVSCLIEEDASGLAGVLFPTWTNACADGSGDVQDDLDSDWQTSGKYSGALDESGRWTYHVNLTDHNNETGLYSVNITAKDGFGNSSSYLAFADIQGGDGSALASSVRASGEFNGHTYVVYEYASSGSRKPALNWNECRSLCESLGGHLVTIADEEENSFVMSLFSSADLYASGSFRSKQAWIGAHGTGSSIEWITGETMDYADWYRSYGSGSYASGSYAAAMSNNGWVSIPKSTCAAFICEFEPQDLSGMDALVLPDSLTEIQSEAFAGISAQVVVLPETCTFIGSRAFASCPNLEYVVVPSLDAVEIADDAFSGSYVTIIEE